MFFFSDGQALNTRFGQLKPDMIFLKSVEQTGESCFCCSLGFLF